MNAPTRTHHHFRASVCRQEGLGGPRSPKSKPELELVGTDGDKPLALRSSPEANLPLA